MDIRFIVDSMLKKETASVPVMGESPGADNILLELQRANEILDKKKDEIFFQHLSISTLGQAEKACSGYDASYFMALPLSLEAISELVRELITRVKQFGVKPSKRWYDIAEGDYPYNKYDQDMEIDYEEEIYRMPPPI